MSFNKKLSWTDSRHKQVMNGEHCCFLCRKAGRLRIASKLVVEIGRYPTGGVIRLIPACHTCSGLENVHPI